jgi:hypothetical protein
MATDDSQQTTEQIEEIRARADEAELVADEYAGSDEQRENEMHAYHRGKAIGLRTALEVLGVDNE